MSDLLLCSNCKNNNICKYRDEYIDKYNKMIEKEANVNTTINPIHLVLRCSSYEQNGKYRHPLDDWDPSGSVKVLKEEIKRGSIK